jgi:peptidoglycan-associated lipoprotein
MKKKIFITTMTLALLMVGCAQKEINTVDIEGEEGTAREHTASTNNGTQIDANEYENVDLYNRENGGNYTYNSTYGEARNGVKNIYFNVNQYIISSDKLPIIKSNTRVLNGAIRAGSQVKIEGHCDASGTDEYNYALGLKRAKATKEAMVSSGMNPSSITMVSMGESSPECTNGYGADCYAKNRRVEFKVIR